MLLIIGAGSIIFFRPDSKKSSPQKTTASNTSAVLTSQDDWNAGTKSNADTSTSPGDVIIEQNVLQGSYYLYKSDGAQQYAAPLAGDGNESTYEQVYVAFGAVEWLKQEYSSKSISKIRILLARGRNEVTDAKISYCSGSCTVVGTQILTDTPTWYEFTISPAQSATSIKIEPNSTPTPPSYAYIRVYELQSYFTPPQYKPTATHTTGATQISGGDSYWGWQTFTPTYTKPTNTNIQFRFRSSTDGSSWTGWSDAQSPNSGSSLDISALVTNRTGDTDNPTYYKYLQIETTLSSTDGVSTPTLDDYSISYHTNVSPSKPTGLTAVIGG